MISISESLAVEESSRYEPGMGSDESLLFKADREREETRGRKAFELAGVSSSKPLEALEDA